MLKKRVMNKIHRVSRQWQNRIEAYGIPPKSKKAYATHLPVLIGLPRLFEVKHVLEFGSGLSSTPLYLNREVFPDLVSVLSYENESEWLEKVQEATQHDSRLQLKLIEGRMAGMVDTLNVGDYDMIFIDDSRGFKVREETIRAIAARCKACGGVVVIHDYERLEYRWASRTFRHHFRFTAFTPNTGVVWNDGSRLASRKLKLMNNLIQQQAEMLDPDDVVGWLRVLSAMDELAKVSE